jgi:urease gamma subunit
MTRNTVLADHIADVSTRADYPEAAAILTNHIRDLADDPRCVQAALLYGSGLWKEATEETFVLEADKIRACLLKAYQ